jgi:predicted enzyme related to lactoylglutathione lyase
VALLATDLDKSIAFYRDVIGLRFIAQYDPPGLAFFNLGGGIRLMLSGTASSATLYFTVADLDSAFNGLKSRGAHFLGPPAMIHHDEAGDFGKKGNEEWMAFFRDPGGNILALVEKR